MARIKFLNTYIDNITMEEAVDRIDDIVQNEMGQYVVTPNVDHIVRLEKDAEFREIYRQARLILTDGQPLVWISKWLRTPIVEKVSGSDLFPKICERAAYKGYRVFLLGAAEGVAAKAAENLKRKYDGLNIVGVYSPPPGFEKDEREMQNIYDMLNSYKIDILIVGLGSPKQERFVFAARRYLQIPVSLNLGASIDFEAGRIKRAPKWVSRIGGEWLFRLIQDPKRLAKRYFVDDLTIFKICLKYRKEK